MPLFKATIDVLIEADGEADACDAIAEAMRPLLRVFAPQSSIIDWKYTDSALDHPVADNGEGFEYSA